MAQQIIASWTNPTHNKDGTPYAESDHESYVVMIDNSAPIKLPLTWGTNFDLGTLPQVQALASGTHTAVVAVKNKKGITGDLASATFSVSPTPAAVGNLSITSS